MFNFLIDKNNQQISQYQKIVDEINIIQNKIQALSDNDLKKQTKKLKTKLTDGYTLDSILPEAFATAKEAIKRILQLNMFDVQVLGGIALHKGKIAEMKTGEGKTIVSILPAYLNCLNNRNVHIITVNDYLAKRDAEWVRPVHELLNLKVGLIQQHMTRTERQNNYACNIIYITNSELGFDYLKDNMAIEKKDVVQTDFHYAIIDEVDSILIDEARTPLIISGPSEAKTTKYTKATEIINYLKNELDYEIDEKARSITLSDRGIRYCEEILQIDNLYNINNPWAQYIINALKAKELFLKNQHYIIKDREIIIVDEFTGRIMHGRRWSDGLHQAIESKESLPIQNENKTLASITYQNLFLLYRKLSGMTGTAKTEETELDKIYSLDVVTIPTNKPCIRKELFDLVYKNEYNKWQAVARECLDMNKIGRPVLVGTTNIDKSELLAKILDNYNLTYNLLNARPENVDREAEIIAQAGREYALTISTNMAGRGTDIVLGGNPKAIAKLIFTNFIKEKIYKVQVNKFNTVGNYKEIAKELEKYRQDIISNKIFKDICLENVNNYLYNIIACNKLTKENDKILKDMYERILHHYEHISKIEKKKVIKLGGLHVIGTERHESRRIDNQLRGRSGRQGDPGSSRFFLSLDDNLLRIFGGDKIKDLMKNLQIDDNIPIESTILSRSLNTAQKKVESYFYDIRKQLFEYDAVINKQRQAIYAERKKILESYFVRDCILEYAENTINEILLFYKTTHKLKKKKLADINTLFNLPYHIDEEFCNRLTPDELKDFLYEQLHVTYDLKEAYLEQLRPGLVRQLEKYYLLEQIDQAWQNHIEKMTLLRESISWRSYGQQDPLIEYKNEAFNLFINMTSYIRQTVVYLIMRSRLIVDTQ